MQIGSPEWIEAIQERAAHRRAEYKEWLFWGTVALLIGALIYGHGKRAGHAEAYRWLCEERGDKLACYALSEFKAAGAEASEGEPRHPER